MKRHRSPKRVQEELAKQLAFETLVSDLSARFVNLTPSEVDREILDAQRRICHLLGLDIVALWQWSEEALGLPVAKTIIEAHKGRLWREEVEGGGACFCFTVPVVARESHGAVRP